MAKLQLIESGHMAFDYGTVPAPIAVEAREAAQRIRLRLRRSAEDIIEIGRDLLAIKASLPHGSFLPWIEAEFGMSEYSARNFMRVAEVYGKRGSVPDLPLSALYELAAPKTPVEVREEVDRLLAAGEIVTKATVDALRRRADQAETYAAAHADRIKELEAKDGAGSHVSIHPRPVLRGAPRWHGIRAVPRAWFARPLRSCAGTILAHRHKFVGQPAPPCKRA